MIFDYESIATFLVQVCDTYEKSAATVTAWANNLYIRLTENPDDVRASELLLLNRLKDEHGFIPANFAANLVYKLQSRLGQDTTGHAGY